MKRQDGTDELSLGRLQVSLRAVESEPASFMTTLLTRLLPSKGRPIPSGPPNNLLAHQPVALLFETSEVANAETVADLLQNWDEHLKEAHIAYEKAASFSSRGSQALGTVVVFLSAIVGGGIFATLQGSPGFAAKVGAGILSVGASASAAVQTFLNLPARTAAYHHTSNEYGKLRRRIEELKLQARNGHDVLPQVQELRGQWDAAESAAWAAPDHVWRKAQGRVLDEMDRESSSGRHRSTR